MKTLVVLPPPWWLAWTLLPSWCIVQSWRSIFTHYLRCSPSASVTSEWRYGLTHPQLQSDSQMILFVCFICRSKLRPRLRCIPSIYHVYTLFIPIYLFIYLFTLFLCIYWRLANLLIIMYLFIVYNFKKMNIHWPCKMLLIFKENVYMHENCRESMGLSFLKRNNVQYQC